MKKPWSSRWYWSLIPAIERVQAFAERWSEAGRWASEDHSTVPTDGVARRAGAIR